MAAATALTASGVYEIILVSTVGRLSRPFSIVRVMVWSVYRVMAETQIQRESMSSSAVIFLEVSEYEKWRRSWLS